MNVVNYVLFLLSAFDNTYMDLQYTNFSYQLILCFH